MRKPYLFPQAAPVLILDIHYAFVGDDEQLLWASRKICLVNWYRFLGPFGREDAYAGKGVATILGRWYEVNGVAMPTGGRSPFGLHAPVRAEPRLQAVLQDHPLPAEGAGGAY